MPTGADTVPPPRPARRPIPGSTGTAAGMLALLALVTGCGSTDPVACDAVGVLRGFSLRIEPPTAARTGAASLEVCWDGTCRQEQVPLHPETTAVVSTCSGESCGVRTEPTGGRFGFVAVPELPTTVVRVRVRITDTAGAPLVERTTELTPHLVSRGDPRCGDGGPQAALTITGDGELRVGR